MSISIKLFFALVFHEPECTPHELSEYEKLRKARIETNQEFLRGLGLARGGYSGVCGCLVGETCRAYSHVFRSNATLPLIGKP